MNSEHICPSGGSFSSFPTRRGHRRMLTCWMNISSAKCLSTFRIHSRFCSRFHFCWTCTTCWCLIHTSIAELKMARISVLFDPSFYTCTNIVSGARFATSYGVSDQMACRFARATCRNSIRLLFSGPWTRSTKWTWYSVVFFVKVIKVSSNS